MVLAHQTDLQHTNIRFGPQPGFDAFKPSLRDYPDQAYYKSCCDLKGLPTVPSYLVLPQNNPNTVRHVTVVELLLPRRTASHCRPSVQTCLHQVGCHAVCINAGGVISA